MRRRKALHIGERGRGVVLFQSEDEEISNSEIVQFGRDFGMQTYSVQGVTENESSIRSEVVKGLDSEVIAGTKEALQPRVPYCEGKISEQMLDAILTPHLVSMQNQFHVGRR